MFPMSFFLFEVRFLHIFELEIPDLNQGLDQKSQTQIHLRAGKKFRRYRTAVRFETPGLDCNEDLEELVL
jgi:hypothetical protein